MTQRTTLLILVLGLILVLAGTFMKIYQYEFANAVLLAGMIIEAYALITLIIRSLKKNNPTNNN